MLNLTPFTENHSQPVSVKQFQAEINKLFGFEPTTGRSWLRIVWMPSTAHDDKGEPETFNWDEYADGGRGGWRRRYLYSADVSYLEMPDPDRPGLFYAKEVWNDIAPPRFQLERFIPPHMALMGWKASGVDPDGMRWTSRRPTFGRYEELMLMPNISELLKGGMLAKHDEFCCKKARAEEVDCYGQYVEPSADHLLELQRLAYLWRKAKERRPGIQTGAEHDDARARSATRNREYWQKFENKIGDIWVDGLKSAKACFSPDPSVREWGRFHFLRAASKSGLTEAEKKESTAGRKTILVTDK